MDSFQVKEVTQVADIEKGRIRCSLCDSNKTASFLKKDSKNLKIHFKEVHKVILDADSLPQFLVRVKDDMKPCIDPVAGDVDTEYFKGFWCPSCEYASTEKYRVNKHGSKIHSVENSAVPGFIQKPSGRYWVKVFPPESYISNESVASNNVSNTSTLLPLTTSDNASVTNSNVLNTSTFPTLMTLNNAPLLPTPDNTPLTTSNGSFYLII